MRDNHFLLIKVLIKADATSNDLAQELDVSTRTIKNYVKQINAIYPDTIQSSTNGYSIDERQALNIIKEFDNTLPQTKKERVNYIITQLVSSKDDYINLYDLSNELYFSTSTLRNDLVDIEQVLERFSLSLIKDGDWIKITGYEQNKRKLISHLLYESSTVNFINMDNLQKAFNQIDISLIQQTIVHSFQKYNYFINDYSLMNLLLHVTIAVDRIKNNIVSEDNDHETLEIQEIEVATDIANKLSSYFDITYNTFEINELALLIASRASSLDISEISPTNITQYIDVEIYRIVEELILYLDNFFYRESSEDSFFDDDFLVRFTLHIRSLIIRSQTKNFSKNPLADTIKKSNPLIYEASVNIASILNDSTDIIISEDEIAYIALHIGSAIETKESLREKYKIIYYCPNYHDIQENVINFLNRYFKDDIVLEAIITNENQINNYKDIDLILTAIPISIPTIIPIIKINMFPNKDDQRKILDELAEIRLKQKKKELKKNLDQVLNKDLFEINHDLNQSVNVINHMSKQLIKLNFVDNTFTKDVLEREAMSSTAFFGAAIPHSIHMNANKTAINILINDKGIKWGDDTVYLVMMMCFNKDDKAIFNEVYESITMILTETTNINKLIKVKNLDDFICTLVNSLEV